MRTIENSPLPIDCVKAPHYSRITSSEEHAAARGKSQGMKAYALYSDYPKT